ncbi:MAG: hypothetical protein PUJ43_01290 [Bacillales bacterium]|nr:hypothetical protein [Bacillales bacterium]MDY5919987.1 hypothetical protein [Candidatus Enteromonas sp.]
MTKDQKILYAMNACYFLYFLILLTERVLSLSLGIASNIPLFRSPFQGAVNVTIFLSVLSFLVYMVIRGRPFVHFLFCPKGYDASSLPLPRLVFAACLLLVSGMVHNECAIPGLQFASYGFFILGILLQMVRLHPKSQNKTLLWLSFAYLVAFSMAIPVAYPSALSYAAFFHVVEFVAVFLLVIAFLMLTLNLYEGREDLFSLPYIVIAVALDAALIALRFPEEINFFVLIFISLSLVLFLIGKFVSAFAKKGAKK